LITKHKAAAATSQQSCDDFLSQLRNLRSDVLRVEKKTVCGFYSKGNNRFAYFFHAAQANRIYIRADGSAELEDGYSRLGVVRRAELKPGWASMYPLHWKVIDSDLSKIAAEIVNLALPLSAKQKRGLPAHSSSPARLPQEVSSNEQYIEGGARQILVNAYERDPKARKACLAHYGTTCCICGFDFSERYGDHFAGVIEVHHLKPLASIGTAYRVNPITDLRPVCPNCHTAIHRRDPPYEIDELRALLRSPLS